MAEEGERLGARKKRAIRLGRKIVRITIGQTKEVYAIHEELLCANSPYFRQKLQKDRKPIEGECAICYEDMRAETQEIIFCMSCGGNLHYDCMKAWGDEQMSRFQDDDEDEVTCPLCRAVWSDWDNRTSICSDLDEEAFATYSEWLYSRTISLGEPTTDNCNIFYQNLATAYNLGTHLKDKEFRKIIVVSFLEAVETTCMFPFRSLDYIYEKTTSGCALRRMIVDVCMAKARVDWFDRSDSQTHCAEFMKDFAIAMIQQRSRGNKLDYTALKTKYAAAEDDGEE